MFNGRETASHIIFATEFNHPGFTGYSDRFINRHIRKTWPSVVRCTGGYTMADGELVTESSYLVPFQANATGATLTNMVHGQESVLILSEVYQKPQLRRAALRYIDSTNLAATYASLMDDSNDVDLGFMQELRPGSYEERSIANMTQWLAEVAEMFGGFTILDGPEHANTLGKVAASGIERVFVASKEVF